MKLVLGQSVDAIDGPFGEISDIIVDAQDWTVAHLVVRTFDDEHTFRLVPFWLVDPDAPRPIIGLTKSYVMRLEMVPLDGLVSVAAEPQVDHMTSGATTEPVSVEQISNRTVVGRPVRSIDGEFAGRVGGFLVTNRHLDAVLVRNSEPAITGLAVVPMIDVDAIRSQRIDLYITRARVDQLFELRPISMSTPRQRRFERETIHAARRLTMHQRPWAWSHRQTWR